MRERARAELSQAEANRNEIKQNVLHKQKREALKSLIHERPFVHAVEVKQASDEAAGVILLLPYHALIGSNEWVPLQRFGHLKGWHLPSQTRVQPPVGLRDGDACRMRGGVASSLAINHTFIPVTRAIRYA